MILKKSEVNISNTSVLVLKTRILKSCKPYIKYLNALNNYLLNKSHYKFDLKMKKNLCYIVPVYNNNAGLNNTLNSIYKDLENQCDILVYDDGSSPPAFVESGFFSSRIKIIRVDENKGVSVAMNRLLSHAFAQNYEYAALIDAGDLHLLGRIESQIATFARNPNAIVVGGDMHITSIDGKSIGYFNPPVGAENIRRAFRRGYPFAHPTAMFRLSEIGIQPIRYNEKIFASVDYDFLYKLHLVDSNYIVNIPEVLVDYVRESGSIGVRSAGKQAREAYRIRFENVRWRDWDAVVGLFDIRLILRAISPKLFFFTSKAYCYFKVC